RATETHIAFSPSQFANEGTPRRPRPQQRPSAIAPERHKVQIPLAVIALQSTRHSNPTPRPTLPTEGRAPSASLNSPQTGHGDILSACFKVNSKEFSGPPVSRGFS